VAWLPIGFATVAAVVALIATSARYGYHRDELYFRMLEPAWGYVDQPPLTPLLARAAIALFGDTVWAMRIPATACVAAAIVLTALIARELGGGRFAQGLAAWGFGFAALPMIMGHVLLTVTVDFAIWTAVLLCVARALLRAAPRWWLAAGALVGLSTYNKLLIVLLMLGLAIGIAAVGPRWVLRSPWVWAGMGLALVIGSPNLIYQLTHEFPQLTMAAALSDSNGGEVRALVLPFQLILVGPPLVAVWVAGIVALLRRPQWRLVRAFAVAYVVLLVIVLAVGGQVYYPFGIMPVLLAAGSVAGADWIARGAVGLRRGLIIAAVAVNAVATVLIALPVLPVEVFGRTPIPELNQVARDQVGWPVYVRAVGDAYQSLPVADRARTIVYTSNYGEAGALNRYGSEYELPAIYSGHNELYFHGPPPVDATVVVAWTHALGGLRPYFASCEQTAVLDNGVGVDNEEQGSVVAICRDPVGGWTQVWPQLQHYD
jgi:4-amino-4-deoxy-L-arabinose transferase-like glycosyltransferase